MQWWQTGIVYQIYPRSFMDSNGDGTGDLPGIEQRLDYLRDLGIDAIWISPIFPSPMADFGYDVSDYTDVHPMFGTLADLDRLVAAAHSRDIKVLLDYVPNHTSDQHPWFIESRRSRTSELRDWYIWHDPSSDGGPPNNWVSVFGGSAWELDPRTGQYYYHAYLKEQPDLNWRNPRVRAAMLDVLRFWLDRGIDGFRVDAVPYLFEREGTNCENLPETHTFCKRLRRFVDDHYPGTVLLAEANQWPADLVSYFGSDDEFHMAFNFPLMPR
jgi:alpha-glucosidase